MVAESRLAQASFSRKSPAKARIGPSSPPISPSSALSRFSSMSAKTTLAPRSAKCRAMARPTPFAAPVTTAVLPAIEKLIG